MKKYYKLFTTGLIAVAISPANAQCPTPTLVVATPSVICAGATTTLNATAVGASINWFTVPVGGVAVGTSASAANFAISPTVTTTYYAESYAISTVTLSYTGVMQSYTVLAGATSLTVDIRGAKGGDNSPSSLGGFGGRTQAVITVTPGQVLQFYIGGQGISSTIPGTGGFNGGGNTLKSFGSGNSGTGGGSTDIRISPFGLANRIVIAGGGGGAGYTTYAGAHGGGLIGQNALPYVTYPLSGGGGGSQLAGGVAGNSGLPTYLCTAGTLLQGGTGDGDGAGSGGGGGGYYGGGGGMFCGGGGGSSYTIPGATSVVHTQGFQNGNGQIIITGTGCTSSSRTPVTVTVGSIPTISVTSGAICAGKSYTMIASGASTYTYSGGSAVVSPTANTSYSVTGTSSLGCVGSNTAVSSVTVNANPTVAASTSNSLICVGQSVVLTASTSATSYTWNTGATTLSVSVSPTVTSTYTVSVSNAVACVASSTVMVTVSPCTGINEILANSISVYPNPNSGILNINLTSELAHNSALEIYDVLGKLVVKQVLSNELNTINISNLNNGIYTYKVLNNSNIVKFGKLIKQ
jgi:hypothetical protein